MSAGLTTARVVAILRAVELAAETPAGAGFRVRKVGRDEIGVTSNAMTTRAGLSFTYRSDAGMGARVISGTPTRPRRPAGAR